MEMNLMEYVPSHLAILIACIYVVGVFLKNLNSVPDKYITIILMLFGITFAVLLSIINAQYKVCLLYTSPSPRDLVPSRMPSSA